MEDLRAVIIEQPLMQLQKPHVAKLFIDILDLRRRGYAAAYPAGCLPVDGTDFIGSQLAICRETASGLQPLLVCKLVALWQCERVRLAFPPLAVLDAAGAREAHTRVEALLADARRAGRAVFYNAAWTVEPRARREPGLPRALREIFTAVGIHYHLHRKVEEWFAFGVRRFNTQQFFSWLGAEAITEALPAAPLADEPVVLLHHRAYSDASLALAEQHIRYWEQCRIFSPGPDVAGEPVPSVRRA